MLHLQIRIGSARGRILRGTARGQFLGGTPPKIFVHPSFMPNY